MKQFLLACLTATSLTAAASLAPVCVAAESMPARVTGNWVVQITGDRFVAGTLHLTQVGDTVIGNDETADGSGVLQINGRFDQRGWGGRKPNGFIVGKLQTATSF